MTPDLETPIVECSACLDTGWLQTACEGRQYIVCGRRRAHQAHTFARPCPCRPINRTYQERVARSRRRAA